MAQRLRFTVLALGLTLTAQLVAQLGAEQRFTKLDADRCQTKLGRITTFANATTSQQGSAKAARLNAQTTQLTDTEVTSYLRYTIKDQVPAGIVEPTLVALGDGRVKGGAVIDLDAVRKQKQRSWADPLNYMTGKLPLSASGLLITQNGVGRFQLESAELSGISIPKSLVQELLSYYSKTADNPSGISIDDPFELPARIKEIKVGRGEAVVVQ